MEKSGESFESWQQRGFKTPTKPKKPKPKKSSEEESCQKTSLEEACSDQAIFKETGTKDWSEVVLNRSKFIVSKLFDKIEIQ